MRLDALLEVERRSKVKPDNPFQKGTLIWSVMEGDWSDLTPKQIGEVLGTSGRSVTAQITKIRHRTGYDVPYRGNSRGRRQKSD